MYTKTILSISFAAIFAVAMIFAQSVSADESTHLDVESFDSVSGAGFLSAEFTVGNSIPLDGSSGAFGYGVVTGFSEGGEPENVLALTTHVCAADHLLQSKAGKKTCDDTIGVLKLLKISKDKKHNGPEMHAHILDLKVVPEGSPCEDTNAPVEVDVSRTLSTGNNFLAMYSIQVDDSESVDGNVIRVSAPTNELAGEEAAAYASYTITPYADKKGNITNLCLTDFTLTGVGGE